MKKAIFTLLLFATTYFSYAQTADVIKKENTVYVESNSSNDHAKQLKDELISRLTEWGYWKITDNKKSADFIMEVEAEASKGITMTSFGGTSVMAKVKLNSKSGDTIWESDGFRSSPNGSNGFNSTKAVAKKIVRALKKKFK